MKKQNFLLVIVVSLIIGCSHSSLLPAPEIREKEPIVLNILGDESLSTQMSSVWLENNVRDVYMRLSAYPGSRIICVSVLSNSSKQQVFSVTVKNADTTPVTSDNFFVRSRQIEKNKKIMVNYIASVENDIKELTELLCKGKTEHASDINGALTLLSTSCNEDIYKNYKKVVLISSDLVVWPPGKKIKAVLLPKDTRILIERPSSAYSHATLKKLFPANDSITIYSSINDAVSAITFFNNQKHK